MCSGLPTNQSFSKCICQQIFFLKWYLSSKWTVENGPLNRYQNYQSFQITYDTIQNSCTNFDNIITGKSYKDKVHFSQVWPCVEQWGGREAEVGFWEPSKDGHCQRNKFPQAMGAKTWLILVVLTLEVEKLTWVP